MQQRQYQRAGQGLTIGVLQAGHELPEMADKFVRVAIAHRAEVIVSGRQCAPESGQHTGDKLAEDLDGVAPGDLFQLIDPLQDGRQVRREAGGYG